MDTFKLHKLYLIVYLDALVRVYTTPEINNPSTEELAAVTIGRLDGMNGNSPKSRMDLYALIKGLVQ